MVVMFAVWSSVELTAVTLRGVSWTEISVPKTEETGWSVGSTDPSVEVGAVTTIVGMVATGALAVVAGAEAAAGAGVVGAISEFVVVCARVDGEQIALRPKEHAKVKYSFIGDFISPATT